MFHKSQSHLFFLVLSVFFVGCINSNHSSKNSVATQTDSTCLINLIKFSDTLKLDTVQFLNYYLSDKKIGINGCDLKKYRTEFKMQSTIVLIILKLYNNNRARGNYDLLAQPIESISNSASKIIFEYAHLYYNKDIYYAEDLHIDYIMGYLKKNPTFLKIPQIKSEYDLALKPIKKKLKIFKY